MPSSDSGPGTPFCPQLLLHPDGSHPACVTSMDASSAFHRTPLSVSPGSCNSTCPKLNPHFSLASKPLPPPVSISGSGTTASHSPSWRLESSSTYCSPSPPTSQPLSLLLPPVHQFQSQPGPATLSSGFGHHSSPLREYLDPCLPPTMSSGLYREGES